MINAQAAGARGVIVANNEAGGLLVEMGGDGSGREPAIPALGISADAGAALRCEVQQHIEAGPLHNMIACAQPTPWLLLPFSVMPAPAQFGIPLASVPCCGLLNASGQCLQRCLCSGIAWAYQVGFVSPDSAG